MTEERDDPWAPHDPWGERDGEHRLPGLRNGPVSTGDRATPLAEVEIAATVPPPSPVESPPVEPTPACLELALYTSDGLPVRWQAFVVTQPGTSLEVRAQTDGDGAASVMVPEAGLYDVVFESPPTLPLRPAERIALPGPWLPRDCMCVHVDTGRVHTLVLARPACTEVVVDGWAQGSKVMRWGGMRPRRDGVATTRGALRVALQRGRGRTLCVAGHADPQGTDAANDSIATERAISVQLFLLGDLRAWAEHAAMHATPLDIECALVACHLILALGGTVALDDASTGAALIAIRDASEGDPRPSDAPFDARDWLVVAELYDLDLAIFMGTNRLGLAQLREKIEWTDAPVVGLGERHPRPSEDLLGVELVALVHRRASILVFGPSDGAQVAVDSGGDEIYDGTYARTTLHVPPEALVQIRVARPTHEPIARGRAWIEVGDLGMSEYWAGVDGVVRLVTLCGDAIVVRSAFDAEGLGTMISEQLL